MRDYGKPGRVATTIRVSMGKPRLNRVVHYLHEDFFTPALCKDGVPATCLPDRMHRIRGVLYCTEK